MKNSKEFRDFIFGLEKCALLQYGVVLAHRSKRLLSLAVSFLTREDTDRFLEDLPTEPDGLGFEEFLPLPDYEKTYAGRDSKRAYSTARARCRYRR